MTDGLRNPENAIVDNMNRMLEFEAFDPGRAVLWFYPEATELNDCDGFVLTPENADALIAMLQKWRGQ